MLRNRSRAVIGKQQSLVADHHRSSQPTPTQNRGRSRVSSFFGSAFGVSRFCSSKPMISPALILDANPFSAFKTRLPDGCFPGGKKRSWEDLESRGIGLAIVDKLFDKLPDCNLPNNKPSRNLVLFGSSMRVRIPPSPAPAVEPIVSSPTEFGIKTRSSQLPSPDPKARGGPNSPRVLTECLSVSDMELSEDYTCVTYHGPNARTTHIYDNCVVESYYSVVLPNKPKVTGTPPSFLSLCYTCNKSLEQTKDIYIYRGEKSFCSQECRHREMVRDGGEELIDHLL